MANVLLTATAVTREALRILHQKLNFVGSIVREYDDSFAKSGAKIGDSLKIRLPNQYVVRTGATLSAQDTSESSVTLQVATQTYQFDLVDTNCGIAGPNAACMMNGVAYFVGKDKRVDEASLKINRGLHQRCRLDEILERTQHHQMIARPQFEASTITTSKAGDAMTARIVRRRDGRL